MRIVVCFVLVFSLWFSVIGRRSLIANRWGNLSSKLPDWNITVLSDHVSCTKLTVVWLWNHLSCPLFYQQMTNFLFHDWCSLYGSVTKWRQLPDHQLLHQFLPAEFVACLLNDITSAFKYKSDKQGNLTTRPADLGALSTLGSSFFLVRRRLKAMKKPCLWSNVKSSAAGSSQESVQAKKNRCRAMEAIDDSRCTLGFD